MINIVILGAGFAGVIAALKLSKKIGYQANITLIDRHDYHLFTTNLYEIAASEEELNTLAQLKKSITLPLAEIFLGHKVNVIKAEIREVNAEAKTVTAGIKKIKYDYLVIAPGSVSDYFDIEGAQKFALPLKNLTDAFNIRNQVEFAVQRQRMEMKKKNIRIVVAGGGYTGVEVAGELTQLLDVLAWKYEYPKENMEVVVIEAAPELVPGLSPRLSADAHGRLRDLGARILLSSPIAKIDEHHVEFNNADRMEYDVLIWAAGVKAANLPFAQALEKDKKGRILANEFLQAREFSNVFVLGDGASINNRDGRPAPPTAQDAIEQAKYLAYALPLIMQNKRPKIAYAGKAHGYIVSIGGKWGILNYGGFYFTGWLAYFVRQLANINYFRQLVGLWKAIKYVLFQMEMYSRND